MTAEFEPADKLGDFWKWGIIAETGEYGATLAVEAVVRNTIANMRRLEEGATLKVVIDYLRSVGYIVIGPEDEGA